jgi:hypothetical protein
MEKIIDFQEIKVAVTWQGRLKSGTDLKVHTGDPGLAINVIQLFLDEMDKRHLWYEQGWLDYEDYQEITITEAEDDDWEGWTRELVLAKKNSSTRNRFV